ncbi:phage tail spike protein [Parvimonas sp. G1641]|uniref:phage tail spike protein n=1 Tax=Parvimonas sp. G1641 TaxID=3388846 RepID=UPI00398022E7
MAKVILFNETEKDFSTRGLGALSDIVDPVITETINGIYDMSFFYPLTGKLFNEISPGRIVFAKGPKSHQAFRIKSIEKDDALNGINVYALHISYDLAGNFIEDTFIQNKGGDGAIKQLLEKTALPHNFIGTSDIPGPFNSRIVRENVLNALLGNEENSFISRAGGQFERDNFRINWLRSMGEDRGVKIKYRKNLVGLIFKEDYTDIVTRVMPQGFDTLFLPEKYIDSPLINNYPNITIKKVKFDSIKSKEINKDDKDALEHQEALKLLKQKAKEYIETVDKPKITADVDFVDLAQTVEYAKYKQLETVYIGDIVTIIHGPFYLNFKKQVTSYRYDPVEDGYIFITLGEAENVVSNSFNSGTIALNKVEDLKRELDTSILEKYKNFATDLINKGFGGFVKYHKDRMLIMDTDDEATATKVWQFNKNGIGYSKTGIQGPYTYAWTIDGVFNTDFIGANSITANKLASDVGQSLDLSSNVSINNVVKKSVTKEVEKVKVGARNLLPNSYFFDKSKWHTFGAKSIEYSKQNDIEDWGDCESIKFVEKNTDVNSNILAFYLFDNLKLQNKDYVFSFDCINFSDFDLKFFLNEYTAEVKEVVKSKEQKRVVLKAKDVKKLFIEVLENNQEPIFSIKKLKVEEGTIATTWVPALEDTEKENEKLKQEILNLTTTNAELAKQLNNLELNNLQLKEFIKSSIKQTHDSITFDFDKFKEIYQNDKSVFQGKFDDISSYIRFDIEGMEMGKKDGEFKMRLSPKKQSFFLKEAEVAYFSNEELYITNARILRSIRIGNFAFVPRENGNLSFRKVVE